MFRGKKDGYGCEEVGEMVWLDLMDNEIDGFYCCRCFMTRLYSCLQCLKDQVQRFIGCLIEWFEKKKALMLISGLLFSSKTYSLENQHQLACSMRLPRSLYGTPFCLTQPSQMISHPARALGYDRASPEISTVVDLSKQTPFSATMSVYSSVTTLRHSLLIP